MNKRKIVTKLLDWWDRNRRYFPWRELEGKNPWIVLGTAILLWKTRAENVVQVYKKFFLRFPSEKVFLKSSETEVKELIKSTGLYNRKYLMLKKLAFFLNSGSLDSNQLSNFGQYIRNLGRLVLYEEDIVPIDAPVLRFLNRLCGFNVRNIRKLTPEEKQFLKDLVRKLPSNRKKKSLYWALVDFADLVCLPRNPRCEDCPFKTDCNFKREK